MVTSGTALELAVMTVMCRQFWSFDGEPDPRNCCAIHSLSAALGELMEDFYNLNTNFGRPTIQPERLFRAMVLRAFQVVSQVVV